MEGTFDFGHQRLDCYRLACGIARWAARQAFPPERHHLRDQLVRAADSVVLNIAEGSGHEPGAARRNHYRIALGSAAETEPSNYPSSGEEPRAAALGRSLGFVVLACRSLAFVALSRRNQRALPLPPPSVSRRRPSWNQPWTTLMLTPNSSARPRVE